MNNYFTRAAVRAIAYALFAQMIHADELSTYRGRVEYVSRGRCDCFYLTLHEKHRWGWRGAEPREDEEHPLGWDWRDDSKKEIVASPYWLPERIMTHRAIRLERNAVAKPLDKYRRAAPPILGSLLSVLELQGMKALPESDLALFLTGADKLRIRMLWPIPKSNLVWGLGNKFSRRVLNSIIGPSGDDGTLYLRIYDAKSRDRLLEIDGAFQHFHVSGIERLATWVDNRYLILPATLHEEIIYVCDLESKRQDEVPVHNPVRRRVFR